VRGRGYMRVHVHAHVHVYSRGREWEGEGCNMYCKCGMPIHAHIVLYGSCPSRAYVCARVLAAAGSEMGWAPEEAPEGPPVAGGALRDLYQLGAEPENRGVAP